MTEWIHPPPFLLDLSQPVTRMTIRLHVQLAKETLVAASRALDAKQIYTHGISEAYDTNEAKRMEIVW